MRRYLEGFNNDFFKYSLLLAVVPCNRLYPILSAIFIIPIDSDDLSKTFCTMIDYKMIKIKNVFKILVDIRVI